MARGAGRVLDRLLPRVFFYPVGWLSARPRFAGLEHIPRTGGVVIVANHISHIDPIYSALAVHLAGRVPRFLAKDSLLRVPVLGTMLRATGQIPVFRGTADAKASLREGTAALEAGKVLIVYPEGTITRDPEHWPMQPRTGVARLALPPTRRWSRWCTGARTTVLDGYRKRFRPLPRTTVTVRCGEPVDLSAYRGRTVDAALLREVTDLIMGRVRDLLAEVRGERRPAGVLPAGDGVTIDDPAGRGAGRRVVGDDLRQGARRRRPRRHALGPPPRGGRGDHGEPAQPRVPARRRLPAAGGDDHRGGRARGRRRRRARRAVADAARQPRRLAVAAPCRTRRWSA